MNRYVFAESRKFIEVIITIAVVAWVVYAFRRRPIMATSVGFAFLLLSCTVIREILFAEKELIITNVYGMKCHIRYDEIKSFGEGLGSHVLAIFALKKKFIPLYFSSRGELRDQMPEILAKLEAATGRMSGTTFESKKSARPATVTHDAAQGLGVTNDGKSDGHVMTRPMFFLAKAVRVLWIGFMVSVVVMFGLGIFIDMHELPDALRNNLEHYRSLSHSVLYGIIILIAVATLYVKVIRHHIIKPKQKSQRNDMNEGD